MPTTTDEPTTLTVLLDDEDSVLPNAWPDDIRVRVLNHCQRVDLASARKLFVLTSATCLHTVAPCVTAANSANRLQALLVRADVDPTWVPFMLEHAHLHVLRNLIVHSSAALPARILTAWAYGEQHDTIAAATVVGSELVIRSCAFDVHRIRFDAYPALRRIRPDDRTAFEIEEDGLLLYWPSADVHLDLEAVRNANDPARQVVLRARQLADAVAFGDAVRAVREERKLTQADVARLGGLSERHVRRIEDGEPPGNEALDGLARAHGMTPDNYVDAVAERMQEPSQSRDEATSSRVRKDRSRSDSSTAVHHLTHSGDTVPRNGRTVSQRKDGSWANTKDGGERASSLHTTQAQAVKAARSQLKETGGGELKVKGENGRIRSKDTIAPAHDPRRTKG